MTGKGQEFRGGTEALAFKPGQEEYGIKIQQIKNILQYNALTKIATAPDFIKGVVNLCDIIVPIVDMRINFGQRSLRHERLAAVTISILPVRLAT